MKKNILLLLGIAAVLAVVLLIVGIKKFWPSCAAKSGSPSCLSLVNQAKEEELKGNLSEARGVYQKLINEFPGSDQVIEWQKKYEGLNIALLFSPAITPKSVLYEIKPGDSLTKIANNFGTTIELIQKSNNISDNKIFPGRKIKVWNAPFSIVVDKSQNTLLLKSGEEVFKTYLVSTGTNNSTPVGTFKIIDKIVNPPWFKPGAPEPIPAGSPENILGTRWMGINVPGYGIHGTTMPQDLGKQVTQGCVRMSNQDVEELYIIVPKGTEVMIMD